MLHQITINKISILDKRIIADSFDTYGTYLKEKYCNDSDDRTSLLLFSICIGEFHALIQLFNTIKVLIMNLDQEKQPTRKMVFSTHTAIVAIMALQYYERISNDHFVKNRCNVLWQKLDKEVF